MNCKPGELAVIVRTRRPEGQEHIGKVVRVTSIHFDKFWYYESPRPLINSANGLPFCSISDRCLLPIRDPDGVDETLRKRETELA